MKKKAKEILDGFLPAMEKIQASKASDDEKKHMAKEWLRSKLSQLDEATDGAENAGQPAGG